MAIVLGSYSFRGNVQPIRLILEHAGEEYTEKFEDVGKDPKKPYGELPYYIEPGQRITGSSEIIEYLAEKYNLIDSSEEGRGKMTDSDILSKFMRNSWDELMYNKTTYESRLTPFRSDLAVRLGGISNQLGIHKWFAGANLTYVDFVVFELLDIHQALFPDCLDSDSYDNLRTFKKNFIALGPIDKYMKSNRYIRRPINSPEAAFGNV